jgi:hypothetical protein
VALGPLLFALASVLLGQDANWDLLNYHLHNPWAWLEGRVGRDLAPAGMQSYFNPLLDVPYYLMVRHLSPAVVAATMGAVQGLGFVALFAIARHYVSGTATATANALALAAAGCASAALLAELGTTMGDATTAPLALAGLATALGAWPTVPRDGHPTPWARLLAAGLMLGAAAGLKLTNAPYALAACLALAVAWPSTMRDRGAVATVFAIGVGVGLAITAGHWFAMLWHTFGNPLFPQFNGLFGAPLADRVGVADTRWLPRGLGEAVAFPFVITANPGRVGERPMLQLVLAATYLLAIAVAVVGVRARLARRRAVPADARAASGLAPSAADGRETFLLAFCALSFVLWMAIFSIHRYLAVLEMVAPAAIWVLVHRLPLRRPRRLARRLLGLSAVVAVASCNHWGSTGFGDTAASVPTPRVAASPDAAVVIAGAPIAWMLPYFPPGPAYLSLAAGFPESPVYVDEARRRLRGATAGVLVVFEVLDAGRIDSIARIDRRLARWAPSADGPVCAGLRWVSARNRRLPAEITPPDSGGRCAVTATPAAVEAYQRRRDDARDERLALLRDRYGLRIDPAACSIERPSWGDRERPYHACPLAGLGG